MRKLKFENFEGRSIEQKLVDFINENNIHESNILKISYSSDVHYGLHLFYYVDMIEEK